PLETWIELLNKYLTDAEQAIINNDAEARKTVREKFHAFIRSTPQKYEFLDDIVRDALQDLNAFDLNLAAGNIKKAAAELRRQRAIIALATKEANEGAKNIQLEHLVEKLDHARDIIEKIEGTAGIMNDDEKDFMEKVKALKNKIDDFKEMM
ncbi:MAG: hypothetical protein KDD04_00970, partial [Sinomicrobium sp.]|nr:hypothetical protein [Sinomicrobium sp.]